MVRSTGLEPVTPTSLILPPNFEDLPTPESRKAAQEDISNFEKTLTKENKLKV